MNGRRFISSIVGAAFAMLSLVAVAHGALAPTRSQDAKVGAGIQTLFSCHADRLLTLRPIDNDSSSSTYDISSRKIIDKQITLTINIKGHNMKISVATNGGTTQSHILEGIHQGSSGGSGAGGRADTTIRGQSGSSTFTLFAGYDNNGFDHDAALQIHMDRDSILVCDSDPYNDPRVVGLGRFGSTSIYTLSSDGLAEELKDLPEEPNTAE